MSERPFNLGEMLAKAPDPKLGELPVSLEAANRARDDVERLRYEANHDPLTGLLNRRGLESRATAIEAAAREQGLPVAVIVCGLNKFKAVNDAFGHKEGDRQLVAVTGKLTSSLREEDTVIARAGGDEFIVFAPLRPHKDMDLPVEKRASALLSRVQDTVDSYCAEQPHLEATGFGASFGGQIFDPSNENVHLLLELVDEADRAMYENKAARSELK